MPVSGHRPPSPPDCEHLTPTVTDGMTEPIILSWSGGKDSALALHQLGGSTRFRVAGLLTTVTEDYDRISMHGVRRRLLERQVEALGLPLTTVGIPPAAANQAYEERMGAALAGLREGGVRTVAFGDLFLEDIRRYRETMLAGAGMAATFPLWGRDTAALAREFLALGFRAVVTCVDCQQLDGAFVGRDYDAAFLHDLPPGVDPCGENGEFHTFVFDGPGFREPVPLRRGEVVLRDERFWFCDLE
jgi:uncharacterized protein (TIGR00290 family)